ncbi:hypothetical protein LUZ60_003209 [Juncus effusus]|nr:hypothetical protein LUZ60_003209 [Juncus effusus]
MDAFTRLTCWFFPQQNQQSPNPNLPNSPISPQNPRTQIHYSPRAHKNREPKSRIDKEYNIVLVPSDGESESDSDESDWSIGWLEPTEFEHEKDSSFAVLVPCYKTGTVREGRLVNGVAGTDDFERNVNEGRNYIEQWLSSLQTPNVNSQFELGSTSMLS